MIFDYEPNWRRECNLNKNGKMLQHKTLVASIQRTQFTVVAMHYALASISHRAKHLRMCASIQFNSIRFVSN